MDSQPKSANTAALNTMARTIEYYSDEELQAMEQEKKDLEEKPFIGIWSFSNSEEMGDGIKYDYTGTIALNLYEKFVPDGGDEPQWGIVFSRMCNTLGANRAGSYNITDFKVNGNTIKINMEEMFSGTRYSATLKYAPADKSMTMSDVLETYGGDEDMLDQIHEPQSEKYSFNQRSTSRQM